MEEIDLTRKQIQKDMIQTQKEGSSAGEGANRNGRWVVKEK